MKKQIRKAFFFLVAGFVVLFGFRLIYGYSVTPELQDRLNSQGNQVESFEFSKKNYASQKLKVDRGTEIQASNVDQKYEKVASITSQSKSFDDEENKVRELVTNYEGLIQYEQSLGLKGNRRVNLAIGVPPDRFDAFVAEVKGIGNIQSIRIDKADKTNEYKDLKAKRISLEKARDSLVALKTRGGQIDESINLESKILEIETEIQSLGVRLGEYDQENEFCTVKLALQEQIVAKTEIPFIHRAKVAFEWTIKYYLLSIAILLAGSLLALTVTALVENLRRVSPTLDKALQKN